MHDCFLELTELRKVFGGVTAVNNLSFAVEEGNVTAVIGPNGAGKTTLFNLITGFLPPTSGTVCFGGKDISFQKAHNIARMGFARTFQNVQVFSEMSALENVMVGRHHRSCTGLVRSFLLPPFLRTEETRIRESAHHWLEFVGMGDVSDREAGSLPLGSQRVLEIARALASEPNLLLLDEPASGLNTRETRGMGELIEKIREMGVTVLLVEHDMELVMDISDEIIVINFGSRIAQGSPREIQENPDVIAAYLGE